MEKPNESVKMLNMFLHPVFTVKDGVVIDRNNAASMVEIGTPVSSFMADSLDEYQAYEGGFLSLTVNFNHIEHLATILRSEDLDVFHLISADLSAEFRTMALISQQLRKPLANIMSVADTLLPAITETSNKSHANQINKHLYQMLRVVSNLSTAQKFAVQNNQPLQMQFLTGIINETMETAITLVAEDRKRLQFSSLCEDIQGTANPELLERALYNLVSNAIKFSPADSTVTAKLVRVGAKLRFTIQNDIEKDADLSNLYARFMREPGIEDGRYGIGLGIPLIQHTAVIHGGSLLMDQPEANKVRFTLTLPIRQDTEKTFHSPTTLFFDYLGGHNHALVELSDILSDARFAEYR